VNKLLISVGFVAVRTLHRNLLMLMTKKAFQQVIQVWSLQQQPEWALNIYTLLS